MKFLFSFSSTLTINLKYSFIFYITINDFDFVIGMLRLRGKVSAKEHIINNFNHILCIHIIAQVKKEPGGGRK